MEFLKKIKIKLALLSLALGFSSGCSHVSYLWQAGLGQWSIYNHEQKISEVISDPATKTAVREKLMLLQNIKIFVEQELAVKATSNYQTYVDLKRKHVVWSLTVARADQLELLQWSFPFFGSFPYLGFFKEEQALAWQSDYRKQGYDTYVRPVNAYSTLGFLRDPFLSSMLDYSESSLVNLIFHETTHQHVYLKGQGSFNEQIASMIGDMGERRYLEKKYGSNSKEIQNFYNEKVDRQLFGKMLRQFADQLRSALASHSGDGYRSNKAKLFTEFQEQLAKAPFKVRGYERFAKIIDNHAALLAFLTYEDDQALFDELAQKCQGQPAAALGFLKEFAKQSFSTSPGQTPQAVLSRLLRSDTSGVVCFNMHF